MKKQLAAIAGLAMAGAAPARVDTTRPMVAGHGNVYVRPAKVIVTHQTATTRQRSSKNSWSPVR